MLLRRLVAMLGGPMPDTVRTNVGLETLGAMIYGGFFAGILAFLPVVLRRLGASPDLIAVYIAFTYIGGVLTPLTVQLIPARRPMLAALAIWTVARGIFVFTLVADQPVPLLLFTFIYSLAEAAVSPVYTQIMQRIYPKEVRGRAMAVPRMGMMLSVIVLTPIGGWLLDTVGHRILFPLAALMGVIAAQVFGRMNLGEEPLNLSSDRSLRSMARILWTDRRFAVFLLGVSVYGVGSLIGAALYPVVQVSRLGLSYTVIGWLGMAQSLTWLVALLLWGRVLDRVGALRTIVAVMIINAGVPLTYIWAYDAWSLAPSFITLGFIAAGFDLGITNASLQLAPAGRLTEYSSLQAMIIGLRGIIFPPLGAALLGMGVADTTIFAFAGAMTISGGIICWLAWRMSPLLTPDALPAEPLTEASPPAASSRSSRV